MLRSALIPSKPTLLSVLPPKRLRSTKSEMAFTESACIVLLNSVDKSEVSKRSPLWSKTKLMELR